MCGIFGVFYTDRAFEQTCREVQLGNGNGNGGDRPKPKVLPHESVLATLAPSNLKRGNKAFGYFAWREDTRFARRFPRPFDMDAITTLRMKLIVCHSRAPTEGDANNIAEVHPYSTEFGELFMNGMLLNYLDFEERRTHNSRVDTAYLAGNLSYHLSHAEPQAPVEDAIANAISEFTGQQACVFVDRRWGETFVWRCMSTLFFGGHRQQGYSVISSTRVARVCEEEVPQGVLYSIDRNRCLLVPRAEFAYKSIYEANTSQS